MATKRIEIQDSVGNIYYPFSDSLSIKHNNTTVFTELEKLSYTEPTILLSSSPSTYTYSKGEIINSVMLNFNITKGSNDLVKAEIYKNGMLLATINNLINGKNSYVDGTKITSDTSYYIKIYDNKGNIQSDEIKYSFFYKAFYGKIDKGIVINESLIQSLNNVIFNKSFNYNANLSDEKIIIVTYEVLSSIIDGNNFNIIDSFTKSNINLNMNNNSIRYNVYTSNNPIIDSNVSINIEK